MALLIQKKKKQTIFFLSRRKWATVASTLISSETDTHCDWYKVHFGRIMIMTNTNMGKKPREFSFLLRQESNT